MPHSYIWHLGSVHLEDWDCGPEGLWALCVFSDQVTSNSLQPHGQQHARLLCPPLSPTVCSNSCPLSQSCYLTISSSATPYPFCLQSLPASGSFPMSWLFTSGGQKIGASASSSVLSMNIQDWSPLGLTGLISLQSKELLRVFSSTTVWKHQLFGTQPSLWSTCVHMEATSVWLGFLTSWQPRKSHTFQLVTEMQKHCPSKQNRATSHFVTQLQKSTVSLTPYRPA